MGPQKTKNFLGKTIQSNRHPLQMYKLIFQKELMYEIIELSWIILYLIFNY